MFWYSNLGNAFVDNFTRSFTGIVLYRHILFSFINYLLSSPLQTVEIFYGTYMATEVAYYTYMYAKVDRELYQKVTSYAKSAVLFARFISGVLAQILVSFKFMDLRELNYISFGGLFL